MINSKNWLHLTEWLLKLIIIFHVNNFSLQKIDSGSMVPERKIFSTPECIKHLKWTNNQFIFHVNVFTCALLLNVNCTACKHVLLNNYIILGASATATPSLGLVSLSTAPCKYHYFMLRMIFTAWLQFLLDRNWISDSNLSWGLM